MKWEDIEERANKNAGRSNYVRLKEDGDKVTGVFVGEPYAEEVVWTGMSTELYDPQNPDHKGLKPKLRILVNFYDLGTETMCIASGGAKWFAGLKKARDKYGLDKWSFEMQRCGAKGDTKTSYTILPEEKLTEEVKAKIAACELHVFDPMERQQKRAAQDSEAADSDAKKDEPW